MASTPQTRGFDVGVMPNVQLANPAAFNSYGALSNGLSAGVGMGAQLQDIILRRQAAEAEAQLRPLRMQLMQAEVARAQQQNHLTDIEMPGKELMAKEPVVVEHNTFTDLDENGNLAEYRREKKVDARTGEVSYAPRIYSRTLKTKQQLEDEKANAAAMRDYRGAMGSAAQTKAATAEQIAQWKQENPTVKTKTFYDADLNVFEQVVNPNGSLGPSVQVVLPNGQPAKRPKSGLSDFSASLAALSHVGENGSGGVGVGNIPVSTAPGIASEQANALSSLAAQFAAGNQTPLRAQKVFANEAEAHVAASKGLIHSGDKITVAGRPATWQ